ncbi:MAG: rhodanese-like domain-containing protein [Methanothrix sp.]|nr:rhodanese-like domain-containing protein [Methanothrix sp.]
MKITFLAIVIAALAMTPWAEGGCSVGGCGGGDDSWAASAQSFMNSDVPLVGVTANQNTNSFNSGSFRAGQSAGGAVNKTVNSTIPGSAAIVSEVYVAPGSRADLFPAPGMLKSLDAISEKDVVLDVSSRRSPGEAHIRGALHIPAKSFFYENGTLRSVSELAEILGGAGISHQDAVMVYSDSFSSGEATAVLCMLRYLGHEDARALDGGLDNWIAASLPMETKENVRPSVSYAVRQQAELLADYDFVKSGQAQMVDARSFQDYGKARISNATFISPENVLEEGRLKGGAGLKDIFARLNASRTTVVYSDDIYEASVVWYALQLMGFDSRIYTWQDWLEHEEEKRSRE